MLQRAGERERVLDAAVAHRAALLRCGYDLRCAERGALASRALKVRAARPIPCAQTQHASAAC